MKNVYYKLQWFFAKDLREDGTYGSWFETNLGENRNEAIREANEMFNKWVESGNSPADSSMVVFQVTPANSNAWKEDREMVVEIGNYKLIDSNVEIQMLRK